jgi:sporulation protein YlmC with PRC-barrel domain
MLSFGLTIVALASVVAPGVLFVVTFFTFSIIKRSAISFGPAIDVAVFFSLSLLINGVFGGFIGWLSLALYDPCGQLLLPEINAVIGRLFLGSVGSGGCSTQSAAAFFYLYLTALCVVSCFAGAVAVACVELSGFRFAHGVFTKVSSVARRSGITTCSALCKFGGENSFVIYIGEVREIVLDDKNSITHLAITKTQRSLLHVQYGITATDAAAIPFVGETDEFIIPGASIENVAFSHVTPTRRPLRAGLVIYRMIALLLVVCALGSIKIYWDMILESPGPAAAVPPQTVSGHAIAPAARRAAPPPAKRRDAVQKP